jgi:hypothetical protein
MDSANLSRFGILSVDPADFKSMNLWSSISAGYLRASEAHRRCDGEQLTVSKLPLKPAGLFGANKDFRAGRRLKLDLNSFVVDDQLPSS